jgi:general secretion pathway protein D
MRLLRLLRSQLVLAVVAGATTLAGCSSLPQGLLLPDLPAAENGTPRTPQTARHGAEGQSSERPRIWGAAEAGQRPASPADQQGRPASRAVIAEAEGDGVTLNLVEASIADAAKAVLGDMLKVNYIIDSRVKGSVTVQTTRPVKQQALLDIFDAVLSGQGARIVVNRDLYRIVPASDAPVGAPISTARSKAKLQAGVSVNVVPLSYVAAAEMEQVLKSVARENAILRVDSARNLLMLTGTTAEMSAMLEVIDVFDVDSMRGMSFALFPVDSADPNTVAQELDTLFANDIASPTKGLVRFVPNRRLRAVLAMSSRPDYLRRAATLVEGLQSASRAGAREIFSYKVRNRSAGELAQLLSRVYGGGSPATTRPGTGSGGEAPTTTEIRPEERPPSSGAATLVDPGRSTSTGSQPLAQPPLPVDPALRFPGGPPPGEERAASRGSVSVVPDEANRMLLITASRSEYKRIVGILDRIDMLPDQVLIEATIAEVTLNDKLRMGVKWFFEAGQSRATFPDGLVSAIAPTFPGFSYALNATNVRVVLDALSDVTDVNIVSSPTLTVLDGKRASLQIGDEVPILTQQAQATVAGSAPIINSITYRNTGVILGLVPRINEKGRVLLEIEQEVSEVGAITPSSLGGSPTITQRRIKTTVAVKDGESLALGGLMQDRSSVGRSQLPILGEVPVVGNLFKSKDDSIKRTELVIIITPRVVRDVNQMQGITDEFRDRLNLTLRPQRQAPPRLREKLDRIQR